MQLPLTDPETLCEDLLQDLPPETAHMARAFNAFVRATKGKTPEPLWRVGFCYGGLDTPWREVAGPMTALYESSTAQSVAARWRAGGPWRHARRRRPLSPLDTLPAARRFVGSDASTSHAPGATGPGQRR
jgi:hypothetical protein